MNVPPAGTKKDCPTARDDPTVTPCTTTSVTVPAAVTNSVPSTPVLLVHAVPEAGREKAVPGTAEPTGLYPGQSEIRITAVGVNARSTWSLNGHRRRCRRGIQPKVYRQSNSRCNCDYRNPSAAVHISSSRASP